MEGFPKLITRVHSECFNYARENDYTLIRYAQGDWQTRDAELILYLEIAGKPPIVGVGLTERTLHCLYSMDRTVDRESQNITSSVVRAGEMMRAAADVEDIPCAAFVPAHDALKMRAYLSWDGSVIHPSHWQILVDFKQGLMPASDAGSPRAVLIVKTMRPIAATARLRKFFDIYLVPLRASDVDTFGLLLAFFDDDDEPLTIRTPLFDDEFVSGILRVLSSEYLNIYFCDENNNYLVGFRAANRDSVRLRDTIETIEFAPETLEQTRQFHDDMMEWFGYRTATEDDSSFRIDLLEVLPPDNLREQMQASPGDLSETDIEVELYRVFGGGQIYRNPARVDDGREFVDVLVATDRLLLLIQAKSSPVTQEALGRTIDRKILTAHKHTKKASAQLKGAIKYLRSDSSVDLITRDQPFELDVSDLDVFGLVIVEELFDHERFACSRLVLSVFEETGVPCLLLDSVEFQELTFFRRTEESLVGTLRQMFTTARRQGLFPRSCFGQVEDGPTARPWPGVADSG